jgi:hypothetical protein
MEIRYQRRAIRGSAALEEGGMEWDGMGLNWPESVAVGKKCCDVVVGDFGMKPRVIMLVAVRVMERLLWLRQAREVLSW